ncbi:hypothetical protein [Pseudomonas putida]
MPTENRSSNTEMVSVPREQLRAWQQRFSKAQMFQQSTEVQAALAHPAPEHHAEPIAWIVGTAIWWTKEEAERDAAAMGLPVVGLGPMTATAPTEQYQGEPIMLTAVATLVDDGDGGLEARWLLEGGTAELFAGMTLLIAENAPDLCREDGSAEVYAHADPGEVERLREGIIKHWKVVCDQRSELETLRAQLAERDALLKEADDFIYIMTGHDSHARLAHKYGDSWWDAINELRGRVCTALSASAEPRPPVKRDALTRMVDDAMSEMSNIHPPLGRGDCARLIRAALERHS